MINAKFLLVIGIFMIGIIPIGSAQLLSDTSKTKNDSFVGGPFVQLSPFYTPSEKDLQAPSYVEEGIRVFLNNPQIVKNENNLCAYSATLHRVLVYDKNNNLLFERKLRPLNEEMFMVKMKLTKSKFILSQYGAQKAYDCGVGKTCYTTPKEKTIVNLKTKEVTFKK
ncbi:MAG: hypothetical protein ACI9J3_000952 [Parvicellaceae bacterium]|jgi:hypothetical protein